MSVKFKCSECGGDIGSDGIRCSPTNICSECGGVEACRDRIR
jgi:hypothetical protein